MGGWVLKKYRMPRTERRRLVQPKTPPDFFLALVADFEGTRSQDEGDRLWIGAFARRRVY
jgi:hypothetical protein